MAQFPDGFFDLAVVDPPYGIKEKSNRKNRPKGELVSRVNYDESLWDQPAPGLEYFTELFRVSKNQIIWGGNYFTNYLKPSRCWIVWDKVNQGSDFADVEMAWTSFFDRSSVLFRYMWNGMMQGKSIAEGHVMQGNKKLNEKRIHPTQKPVNLYRWTFDKFAEEGMKVMDNTLGSGSSRIAAFDAGLDFYGCEMVPNYFFNQGLRFRKFSNQMKLFD